MGNAQQVRPDKDFVQIVILGANDSGKSALVERFATTHFSGNTTSTIGLEFCVEEVFGARVRIWDTGGDRRYFSIITSYFNCANAIMLVFDLAADDGFDRCKCYWAQMKPFLRGRDVPKILIGTKMDLLPPLEIANLTNLPSDITDLALEYLPKRAEGVNTFTDKEGFRFVEVSSKTGENVLLAFETLIMPLITDNQPQTSS